MSSGRVSKVDMLTKVYKMKNELYNGTYKGKSFEWYSGAHDTLNRILDLLDEYSS